jgi:hypothetical protein
VSSSLIDKFGRLVVLFQIAKQLLLDFDSVSTGFHPQGCKFRGSCEDIVDYHWLGVAAVHVALADSKLMELMML